MTRMPATLCLLNQTVTTAQTNVAYVTVPGLARAKSIGLQCIFTYGAAGTSCKAYVQTSFDGGQTFVDVACFAHLTTSLNRYYNISGLTPVTAVATLNDNSNHIADNTCVDGVVGDQWRVVLVTTGTYTTNTTIQVYAIARD